ncbi:hypothetical protein SynPROS91_02298 [Synechococcus sp. PROS-9-1]|nr:hypothetical protein SynPROS91_02298 [Synechococcus sp. PROS-9-1]
MNSGVDGFSLMTCQRQPERQISADSGSSEQGRERRHLSDQWHK